MAKRSKNEDQPDPELKVDLPIAIGRINERIDIARAYLNRKVSTTQELESLEREYYKWDAYNTELLTRIFTTSKFADEYSWWGVAGGGPETEHERLMGLRKDVADKIHRLESIRERLDLVPVAGAPQRSEAQPARTHTNRVFVVHGHDEGVREAIARFIATLGIQPIILHEQATGGRTLMEKLEHYSDVDFAVVLLTPDDVGGVNPSPLEHQRFRARQNVILELGYFVGKLGRNKVCTLYKADLELPSDVLGVVYVPLDAGGGWRIELTKELREAGFAVDMNKVV